MSVIDIRLAVDPGAAMPGGGSPHWPVSVEAFGQSLILETTGDRFLADDSLWRLGAIHQPVLARADLAPTGCMIDIGAGFGSFALPFARAHPGWTVWCLEPDPLAHAALMRNIARLGLGNVIALRVAVLPDAAFEVALPGGVGLALSDPTRLHGLCPGVAMRRNAAKPAFVEWCPQDRDIPGTFCSDLPALPVSVLGALRPDAVKLIAPGAEQPLLEALMPLGLSLLMGESWGPLDARLMQGPGAPRLTHVQIAGQPELALRTGAALRPDPAHLLTRRPLPPDQVARMQRLARWSGAEAVAIGHRPPPGVHLHSWDGLCWGGLPGPAPSSATRVPRIDGLLCHEPCAATDPGRAAAALLARGARVVWLAADPPARRQGPAGVAAGIGRRLGRLALALRSRAAA